MIDADCAEVASAGPPAGYDEAAQRDFLLNYVAMATTLSPLHGPIPRAAVGLELDVIPPLGCARRLVMAYTKTEDTNKTPLAPRPRVLARLPDIGKVTPYAGLAYVPPVELFGTRSVIVSLEVGAGVPLAARWEVGARFHATVVKSVGDYATAFGADDPAYDDLFVGSTFGADVLGGLRVGDVVPYVAIGFTDASTFFYVGDDGTIVNNGAPYAGPVGSAGVEVAVGRRLDLAAEAYVAPGVILTGRLRAAYRF